MRKWVQDDILSRLIDLHRLHPEESNRVGIVCDCAEDLGFGWPDMRDLYERPPVCRVDMQMVAKGAVGKIFGPFDGFTGDYYPDADQDDSLRGVLREWCLRRGKDFKAEMISAWCIRPWFPREVWRSTTACYPSMVLTLPSEEHARRELKRRVVYEFSCAW